MSEPSSYTERSNTAHLEISFNDFPKETLDAMKSLGTKEKAALCDQNCDQNCGTPCEWAADRLKTKGKPNISGALLDDLNPSITSDGKPRKHIRRACLECRKRHIRCDGVLPICKKCSDANRECNYVPSNRGGVRIPRKKVLSSQQKSESDPASTMQRQFQLSIDNSSTSPVNYDPLVTKKDKFRPCMISSLTEISSSNSSTTQDSPIMSSIFDMPTKPNSQVKSVSLQNLTQTSNPEAMPSLTENSDLQDVINGVVSLSPYAEKLTPRIGLSPGSSYPDSSGAYHFDSYILSPSHEINSTLASNPETINLYYTNFHSKHPILPPKEQFFDYINIVKGEELLKVMQLITHIMGSPSLSLGDLLPQLQYAKEAIQQAPNDLIKVQASLLLAIAAHLCTDNSTSIYLRTWCFDVCNKAISKYSLSTPSDSGSTFEQSFPYEYFSSQRTSSLDRQLFTDLITISIHESYFLDVMFAVISRGRISSFAESDMIDNIPIKDVPGFAYKSRFKTIKIVKSLIVTLAALGSSINTSPEFPRLEAMLTTYQGYMSDEVDGYSHFPPLVDDSGLINDGIHQANMMLNFAAILLHFPFSSLYQNKLPSFVQCTDDSAPIVSVNKSSISRQRTIVSTRHCIQAASNIIKMVTDMGSASIPGRTPLFTCSLSMAMLVHMKAYHWLTRPNECGNTPVMDVSHRKDEIGLYEAYIKLATSSLQIYGTRWILPTKLCTSLCNVMFNVLPELYESIVETEISKKRKADDDLFLEKDCWMKNLKIDESSSALTKPTLDIFDQLFDLDFTPTSL